MHSSDDQKFKRSHNMKHKYNNILSNLRFNILHILKIMAEIIIKTSCQIR